MTRPSEGGSRGRVASQHERHRSNDVLDRGEVGLGSGRDVSERCAGRVVCLVQGRKSRCADCALPRRAGGDKGDRVSRDGRQPRRGGAFLGINRLRRDLCARQHCYRGEFLAIRSRRRGQCGVWRCGAAEDDDAELIIRGRRRNPALGWCCTHTGHWPGPRSESPRHQSCDRTEPWRTQSEAMPASTVAPRLVGPALHRGTHRVRRRAA